MKNKVIALLTLGCFLIADSADKIEQKTSAQKVTEGSLNLFQGGGYGYQLGISKLQGTRI